MASNITTLGAETLNDDLRKVLLPVTVYVGAEAVLGFFGNLIVLFVFKFRYHVCNFRYFVLCLALTDVIASCTAISGEVVTQLFWYIYPFPTICKIKSFFNVFTVFAEAFCLLTIAVDRYRKVCKPLGWQITPRKALVVCFIIYAVSAIVATPVAVFWGTHTQVLNKTAITLDGIYVEADVTINVTICEIDQRFIGQSDPRNYTYSLETIISLSLLPMFVLYIFVAKTLIGSSKLKEKRRSMVKNANAKPRYDNKSDTDYITDDDSKASTSNSLGVNARKVLPSKPSTLKVDDVDLDVSTGNSMTTTQNIPSAAESPCPGNSHKPSSKPARRNKVASSRVRRKTLIMFILTVVFIITTITYLTMLGLIAGDILDTLSHSEKAVYFFFFRFYFINHVINPLVYGLLDPQFRRVMRDVFEKIRGCCSRNSIDKV